MLMSASDKIVVAKKPIPGICAFPSIICKYALIN
ncbi:hypothetical protein C7450_11975 [Chelatococcus asaccharovorans]|uniref:Uncharacterized protein n=1 Tax=Chelatococcus asaccharovorans TaxID=28210 RepID=A0A2V3TTL0_9HYPH|nr:hypothetical protein C7450_11975 [Chelatococcus asaccharovorans]